MGSYSLSQNSAVDNRLAVTDQALGVSSSGSNNNLTLGGHVFDFAGVSIGGSGSSSSGSGGLSVNLLDGGAVDRAFTFAENSLSSMLGSVITQQRETLAAQTSAADTLSAAIVSQAQQTAAATQAATANTTSMVQYLSDNMQKIAIGAVVLGAGWYFMKGRR